MDYMSKLKIICAYYGDFKGTNDIRVDEKIEVTNILIDKIVNNKLIINVSNDNFTDPINGVVKRLYVKYEYDNNTYEEFFNEGNTIEIPQKNNVIHLQKEHYDILLLTSCNRIKQVLLSLSINYQIIKERFNVIIMDNSTPDIDAQTACNQLQNEDPYNVVKPYNYCSDINLLYDAHKYFPNINEFKVIHQSPRLTKQRGESTLVALGLMQASLMGNRVSKKQNYCLKLTGTSILKYDILSELINHLNDDFDIMTWHRANIGGYERSTRIFGCKPNILSSIIVNEGWYNWCDDNSGVFEQRFARILNRSIPDRVYYTNNDESGILLEGGVSMQQSYGRERILNFIDEKNIDVKATPYLEEFMNGGIW